MGLGTPLPNKKDVAQALLLKGAVFVHLDPRGDDVIVPPWLKRQIQLVLQIGLDMPVPIPDLRIDEAGLFGTLSFNRSGFTCSFPWDAVFALVGDDGRGMAWPESMPREIADEVEREARRAHAARADAVRGNGNPDRGEASPIKRRRRAAVTADRGSDPSPTAPRPKRADLGVASLSLIAGEGNGDASARSARRALPPYLRVVK